MPSYGPNTADTGASVPNGLPEEQVWTDPGNTATQDTNYAGCTPYYAYPEPGMAQTHDNPSGSEDLTLTDFDFSVPSDEFVTQTVVAVRRRKTTPSENGIVDYRALLVINGSADASDNQADTVTEWTGSFVTIQYTFSRILSASTVNASDFGFAFAILATGDPLPVPFVGDPGAAAQVDLVTITLTTSQGGTYESFKVFPPFSTQVF